MTPNPIHKVLSTFRSCGVRALLMDGQACVFYGATGMGHFLQVSSQFAFRLMRRKTMASSSASNCSAITDSNSGAEVFSFVMVMGWLTSAR